MHYSSDYPCLLSFYLPPPIKPARPAIHPKRRIISPRPTLEGVSIDRQYPLRISQERRDSPCLSLSQFQRYAHYMRPRVTAYSDNGTLYRSLEWPLPG